MVVPGKKGWIHFFLSLTEGPAFGILLPADLIGSVQPIYLCAGIRPLVENKSNSHYKCLIIMIFFFLHILLSQLGL